MYGRIYDNGRFILLVICDKPLGLAHRWITTDGQNLGWTAAIATGKEKFNSFRWAKSELHKHYNVIKEVEVKSSSERVFEIVEK